MTEHETNTVEKKFTVKKVIAFIGIPRIVTISILALATLTVFAIVKSSNTDFPSRAPYDKTGFVDKEDVLDSALTLENSRYTFTLDKDTTHFEITDKLNLNAIKSHPIGDFDDLSVDAKELFIVYYEQKLESPTPMRVNDESIRHGHYQFRTTSESIEVLYRVGQKVNITASDLPQMIPSDKMEELILPTLEAIAENNATVRRNLRFFTSQYVILPQGGAYYLRSVASQDGIDMLYDLLFNLSGYTYEDYLEDNQRYGFEAPQIPYFEFSVIYTLTPSGFTFRLVNASIVETSRYPLAYMDLLPFLGSGNLSTEGFTVLPDGSGVIMDHNNGRYNALPYSRRIYGVDYAITSSLQRMPQAQEDIMLPLYAMNTEGVGFSHFIEEGAAMSRLLAGFKTESSAGVLRHKNPYAHFRYSFRERDAYVFSSIGSNQNVTLWTSDYNTEDFYSHILLNDSFDPSYTDLAKDVQAFMLNQGYLPQTPKMLPNRLNITFLGGYRYNDFFLGIPYQKVGSLTTFKQAEAIVSELIEEDITHLNITYQGFANTGIKPYYMNQLSFDSRVGTQSEFKALNDALEAQGIHFVPEIYAQTAFTDAHITPKKHSITDIFYKPVIRYDFNRATLLPNRDTSAMYTMRPEVSAATALSVSQRFSSLGINAIGFVDYGNQLNSSLDRKNTVFKNEALQHIESTLQTLSQEERLIMIRNPHLYALSYLTYALDVPTIGTTFQVVDYAVPFIQLIYSGHLAYASKSINTDDAYSLDWHLLKAIETGSMLNFTWTYDNTIKLASTEYSYLYSTYYKNWMDQSITMYNTLSDLGIYDAALIAHETLNQDGSQVLVTYASGLSIHIDYNTMNYLVITGGA